MNLSCFSNSDPSSENKLLSNIVASNLSQRLAYIPLQVDSMEIMHCGNITLTNSGLHSCIFNSVYCSSLHIDALREIKRMYGESKQQILLWMGPESEGKCPTNKVMINEGFHYVECCIGMVYDIQSICKTTNTTSFLQIKECINAEDFSDFAQVISSVYEPARACIEEFYKIVSSLKSKQRSDCSFFVGYINQKPVVTTSIFFGKEECGIYDVATHPEYRRMGYASEMFNSTLLFAQKLGKKLGVLQSSPEAFNLYKKLGCQEVCKFILWSNEKLDF